MNNLFIKLENLLKCITSLIFILIIVPLTEGLPYTLNYADIPAAQEVVAARPALAPQVSTLFSSFLAPSTYKNYGAVIRDFQEFYNLHGSQDDYKSFNESDVIHFLAFQMAKEQKYSYFKKVKPSLQSLEKTIGFKMRFDLYYQRQYPIQCEGYI